MREQEVRELYEAYLQVHQPQEEVEHLDEFAPGLQKFVDDATKKGGNILRQIPGVAAVLSPAGKGKRTVTAGEQKANIKQNVPLKNSFDPFDAILEHLVAEGYADTNESALAIMANMSEEWRQSIVEGFPNVQNKPRPGDAGTSGLKMIQTPGGQRGYINKHSGGEILPSGTVDKIMGGNLMVKNGTKKNTNSNIA